jgi:hydrogenase nickel incorporation protein HypA/HybF
MHELSIIENILNIIIGIAQKEGLTSITKVVLEIGELRQIVPQTMRFAFEAASKGSIAESAVLEMEFVPVKARCNSCTREFLINDNIFLCAHCGGTDLSVTEGQELIIKNIEGEN